MYSKFLLFFFRNSIFNDNLHKYGDFLLKMNDGETVSMLEELLNTGFVADDVDLFHRNLKMKLDSINSVEIFNDVRTSLKGKFNEHLDTIFKMQTSIFLMTVDVNESALACADVREQYLQLLTHKNLNDFNACQDVDEESAGRACKKGKNASSSLNSALMKKLNLIHTQSVAGVNGASSSRKNNDDRSSECNQSKDISSMKMKNNNRKGIAFYI